MKTAVMTDTNSGITKQEADALGIFLMQMPVIIDGETHYEGLDLTHDSFFAALTGNQNVSTSQPSPGDVMDMWDEILNSGYDEIIYIPMSSGLSASCEAAMGLALDYDGKVQVANNHRISVTMRISVMEAKHYADLGASAAKIKELLETNAFNSSIYIAVDTLEFLKRGGRVTAAGAALGSVLNIKPVLTIQGERLDAFAKVRGMKKAKLRMIEALKMILKPVSRVSRKNVCVSVLQVPVLVQSRKKNGQICFLRPSLKWMSTMIRFLSAFPATSDLVVTVSVSA